MNIYQYTCAHSTSYWITEQNSRIVSWTKSYNNLELTGYSLHHTTHRVMASSKSSTNTWNPMNWDKYLNQVFASYRTTPNLATAETPFFLVYGRDPDSGMLNLETHRLALAIAKKTLDENRFKTAQKTMAWEKPAFQVGDLVYFKNKQPGKWDLKLRPRYTIVHIEHDGHFIHIENQATGKILSCNVSDIILEPPIKILNIETQFGRAGRYINHPVNLPTIKLMDSS